MRFNKALISAGLAAVVCSGCSTITPEEIIENRNVNAEFDILKFKDRSVKLEEALSLDAAIAFALEHNMQIWMGRQEEKIQQELRTGSYLKLLPQLQLNAEHSRASRYKASSSTGVETGTESLTSSYSHEKKTNTFDAGMVWNVLDFGVTYLRSQQQEKQVHIAAQELRRTRQQIIMEVQTAYWNAQAATEAAAIAQSVGGALESQRQTLKSQMDNNQISRVQGLQSEVQLLSRQSTLKRYKQAAKEAKLELARLIGLNVSDDYELVVENFDAVEVLTIGDVEALESYAILNRPELYTKDLEESITSDEAKAKLIQMFPSPSLFARYNSDDDKFAYHKDWTTVGLTAAWDIFSIPSKIYEKKALEQRGELFKKERIAIAVGILTQFHISLIEYQQATQQMEFAQVISLKHGQLLKALADSKEQGGGNKGDVIAQKLQYLLSRSQYLSTVAEMQSSYARVLNTLGVDPNETGEVAMPTVVQQ